MASLATSLAEAGHPLDALAGEEITRVLLVLKQAGKTDALTRFPTITLLEPPKYDVLHWQGERLARKAKVTVKAGSVVSEAVVDLDRGEIEVWEEVKNVQPAIMGEEWSLASELTMADARWQAGMLARGYSSFEKIFCDSYTVGYFGPSPSEGRRLVNVPCFDIADGGNNLYARPIEGLYTVIDLNARQVLEVVDTGTIPLAGPNVSIRSDVLSKSPKPSNERKLAPDYLLGGGLIRWRSWSFHLRLDRRFGPVLSLVSSLDNGVLRSVLYQGHLSELFVPYMDANPFWATRTFMDVGEYGFGRLASTLVPGTDCPIDADFLNASMVNERGVVYDASQVMCLFERKLDAPVWRHAETLNDSYVGRTGRELVLRTISTIGNYDYVLDWVLTEHGEIRVDVGATGYPAVKGVKGLSETKEQNAAVGRIAPNLEAVFHDHFLSFRFDIDVDGPANDFLRRTLVTNALPSSSPRRSLWTAEDHFVTTEGGISARHGPESWVVVNSNEVAMLGRHPGYEIVSGHSATSLLSADDWPQRRAAFSGEQLWVTLQKPDELFAAGAYPNQSQGGDGLPQYANGEYLRNADIVAWYTMGFHHLTRPEDWPIQSTVWHSVTLRPSSFFTSNPTTQNP